MSESTTDTVIEVRGLTVERSGHGILRNISWSIREGENWVLLGANGSGKTSLLRCVTGYLMPTLGTVQIRGERVVWPEMRKHIGFVSSDLKQRIEDVETALETVISGREAMINYWGEPSTVEVERAMELLSDVGCADLAGRHWRFLSQGERQRVLIARARMVDGLEVLILDEPCAGLDPVAREQFLEFMENFAAKPEAPPLVLVTHHVEEVMPAFSKVIMLREGAMVGKGEVDDELTSARLTETFCAEVELSEDRGRYTVRIK